MYHLHRTRCVNLLSRLLVKVPFSGMRTLTSASERPFSLPTHRTTPMPAAERPTIRWGMNSLPQRTLPRLRAAQASPAAQSHEPLYMRTTACSPMCPLNLPKDTSPMVGESLINPCACPIRRMKQHEKTCSRAFVTNHIGLALGLARTVGGGGGQGDRRRLLHCAF